MDPQNYPRKPERFSGPLEVLRYYDALKAHHKARLAAGLPKYSEAELDEMDPDSAKEIRKKQRGDKKRAPGGASRRKGE